MTVFLSNIFSWMHQYVLLPTLHNGHQSSADSRHHIPQEPLFNFVDSQPANDRQEGKRGSLGSLTIPALYKRKHSSWTLIKLLHFSDITITFNGNYLLLFFCFAMDLQLGNELWCCKADHHNLYSREILKNMVQFGFPLARNSLIMFSKAVLRVHGSGHFILSPGNGHLPSSESTLEGSEAPLSLSRNLWSQGFPSHCLLSAVWDQTFIPLAL